MAATKTVPASRKAWGSATPDVDAIAAHALDLIDQDGLQALTVRSLAEHMGANHGNLYRRFATRDELLDCVAAQIVAEAELEAITTTGIAWAYEAGHRLRTAWTSHPHACTLISLGRRTTAALVDRLVQEMLTLELSPRERVTLLQGYLAFLVGWILISAQDVPRGNGSESIADFPHLLALQAEVATLGAERTTLGDAAFSHGLAQVLGAPSLAGGAR